MQAVPEANRHRDILAGVLGSFDEVCALPGGSIGCSYRLSVNGSDLAAKFFDPNADVLLGPAEQFELLRTLAAAGIAPEPLACYPEQGLLLTRFLDSTVTSNAAALSQPAMLASVATLLRTLHAVETGIPGLDPVACADRYTGRLGGEHRLSPHDRARFDELRELAEVVEISGNSLCHNDLVAANIVLGDKPALIDFDFAVSAAPILDLASLVVLSQLDDDCARELVHQYAGPEWPFTEQSFWRVQRLHRLLAHFWALSASGSGAAIVAQYRLSDD